jgi:hypothetical protein
MFNDSFVRMSVKMSGAIKLEELEIARKQQEIINMKLDGEAKRLDNKKKKKEIFLYPVVIFSGAIAALSGVAAIILKWIEKF